MSASYSESREEPPAKRQHQPTLFAHFSSKEHSSDVRELESCEETSGNVSETESVDQTGSISVDHSEGNDNDNDKDVVPNSFNPGTCQGMCCQLLDQKEFFQRSGKDILHKTFRKQGSRQRSFSSHCYKDYPWITLCTTTGKVLCWHCTQMVETCATSMAKRTENAFTQTGFDNWKKAGEKFAAHSCSQLHREAVMKWKLGQQPGIAAVMDQSCKAEQTCHREMLIKQLESLRYLFKQGLAVRGHEEADGNLYQLLLL